MDTWSRTAELWWLDRAGSNVAVGGDNKSYIVFIFGRTGDAYAYETYGPYLTLEAAKLAAVMIYG